MPWAAAAGAVASLGAAAITSSSGKSGGSQQTATTNEPWAPQQPYIAQGLQSAQDIYGTRAANGPYTGGFFAGQNPTQGAAVNNAGAFAGTTGAYLPGATAQTANTLQTGASPYVANAARIAQAGGSPLAGVLNGYATGATPAVSTNSGLSGALNDAAITGANTLNGFGQGQQRVMNEALADPTQQLSDQASAYMNSSPVQGAVNSTNALINQQLHEQTVPGLNRAAAAGGVLNSSRTGMAEGMANEGAGLAMGNADSSILNNAWNTGLSTAAAERNAGLTTGMYAANAGLVDNSNLAQQEQTAQTGQSEFGTNTALAAATGGINANLGQENVNLGANAQLGAGATAGINGATASGQQAAQDFALGSSAGGLKQQGDQTNLNNDYAKWQMANQYPQGVLNDYWNIVGRPVGTASTGVSSSQLPTNYGGAALGGGLAGAGLYQNYLQGSQPNYDPTTYDANGLTPQALAQIQGTVPQTGYQQPQFAQGGLY